MLAQRLTSSRQSNITGYVKRSDVGALIEPEQEANHFLRVQQLAERVVGVLADVPEERLREQDNLHRGRFDRFAHRPLTGAPLRVELLGGRLVLVVVLRELPLRSLHELRVAVHQALHISRRDPV